MWPHSGRARLRPSLSHPGSRCNRFQQSNKCPFTNARGDALHDNDGLEKWVSESELVLSRCSEPLLDLAAGLVCGKFV
jgi:hypothetical protein